MRLVTAVLVSLSGLLLSSALLAGQQFQPAVNYTVGPYAGTAVGGIPVDVNNDGNLDLVVVNEVNSKVCSVLLGNGDGTFQPALTFHTGGRPIDVAAGDFNLDGNQDLAIADFPPGAGVGTLELFLGNGDGTFTRSASYQLGLGTRRIVASDFNGDGKLDVAVTDTMRGNVLVFFGNGDGTLQPATGYTVPGGAYGILAGDLNGDGHPDLVITNNKKSIFIFLNQDNGSFLSVASYQAGEYTTFGTIADLNHDGKADLAFTSGSTNEVTIFLGNGDGTFTTGNSYSTSPAGTGPSLVVAADFNLDGNLDLVVEDYGSDAALFYGNGDGTFQSAVPVNVLGYQAGLAAADFDKNGAPDLAVLTGASTPVESILLNTQ